MDLNDAVARLAALRQILDDADSASILEDLARSAFAVVPSSLAVVIMFDGQPGPLAVVSDRFSLVEASAHSSLRLEFVSQGSNLEDPQLHRLIFIAEAIDAFSGFKDLQSTALPTATGSADLANRSRHRLTDIVIDDDLDDDYSYHRDTIGDLVRSTGKVDRAVGFLIDRGYEPAEAIHLLEDRAHLWMLTLEEAADKILHSLD